LTKNLMASWQAREGAIDKEDKTEHKEDIWMDWYCGKMKTVFVR